MSKKLTDYASGSFLKPLNVVSEKEEFAVIKVEESKREGTNEEILRVTLSKDNGENEFDFDLNKTNAKFLVSKGLVEINDLVGKKLCFKKALVRNPRTNLEQEGLRICDVK